MRLYTINLEILRYNIVFKRLYIILSLTVLFAAGARAQYDASYVTGINPIEGTDLYASISNDGQQVVSYSFKTGKQVAVLFDVEAAKAPMKSVDGYVISPDGKKMLVFTKSKAVYRRSFKAEYFIYDIARKTIKKLSEGENQQGENT